MTTALQAGTGRASYAVRPDPAFEGGLVVMPTPTSAKRIRFAVETDADRYSFCWPQRPPEDWVEDDDDDDDDIDITGDSGIRSLMLSFCLPVEGVPAWTDDERRAARKAMRAVGFVPVTTRRQ